VSDCAGAGEQGRGRGMGQVMQMKAGWGMGVVITFHQTCRVIEWVIVQLIERLCQDECGTGVLHPYWAWLLPCMLLHHQLSF
jgi:hypothetical protein